MLNHLILFEQFGDGKIRSKPEFDEGESFKIGDMVYVDPYVCGRQYNLNPSVQYEIIELEGNNAFLFDDENEYIRIRTSRLNVAYEKAPEDDVRWFEDGKLED
jgi:hypothetical protein